MKKFQYIWSPQFPQLKLITIYKIKNLDTLRFINDLENFPLPKTKIVNLNVKKIKNKFIAEETIEMVDEYLKKDEQVLFFINRRGFAPYLICKKCGFKHTCKNCSMYLTFHKLKNRAICHHCSFAKKLKVNVKLKEIAIL